MSRRGTLQLWANHLADDLRDLEAGRSVPRQPCERRVESLRVFARQVQHGANPLHVNPMPEPSAMLGPSQRKRADPLDDAQQSYALLVWLAGADPVVRSDGPAEWAKTVERVADGILSQGWSGIDEDLRRFTRESLKPFLARLERLDEAPDDDFAMLALTQSPRRRDVAGNR